MSIWVITNDFGKTLEVDAETRQEAKAQAFLQYPTAYITSIKLKGEEDEKA